MDAPSIRYAKTSDGRRIAYVSHGSGTPMIMPSTLGFDGPLWETDEWSAWIAGLAGRFHLAVFDAPGLGMSDPAAGANPISPSSVAPAIEAVAASLGAAEFGLYGEYYLAPAVLEYAAKNPARVQSLIVFNGMTALSQVGDNSAVAQARPVAARDFQMWLRMILPVFTGRGASSDLINRYVDQLAGTTGYEEFIVRLGEWQPTTRTDVDLSLISAPTLILQTRQFSTLPAEVGRDIAASIPGASHVVLTGDAGASFAADQATLFAAIDNLGSLQAGSDAGGRAGFQTILFTDLEASTPLTQRLGDEGAQKLLRGHNAAVRGALDEHGGREVKHTGDGIMASFPSAVAAVTAALQIQRELAGGEVRVRVGLNAGEPIAEDDDLFGLSVIKAARVADRAEPGQVLVSRVVRELCEGKTFQFSSLGEVQLKGFDEAVELFEVTGSS